MPKPEDSYTWDNNSTNEAVPTSNHANDGYAPNEIPASDEFNRKARINGEVSRWIAEGSSGGEETAHLVETDEDGASSIAVLTVGPPTPAGAALTVAGSAAGGVALVAVGSTSSPAVSALGGGDAAIVAEGQDGGNGINATGSDLGHGVVGQGGEGGAGVVGTPGSGGPAGVQGNGVGSAPGVYGVGGSTGGGVQGIPGFASGVGVFGQSHASGSTSGIAVYGLATADATGVRGQAADGYGVYARSDTTSPARSALHIEPQNADPTTLEDGDVWVNSTTDEVRFRVDSGTKTAWGTSDGFTFGADANNSASNNNAAAWTTLATVSLSAPYDPKHVGTVIISCAAEFGATGGTVQTTIELQIYDSTDAAVVWTRTIDHPAAVAGSIYDRPWSMQYQYTLPSTGARTFLLQFRKTGGATGVQARDGSMVITGVY